METDEAKKWSGTPSLTASSTVKQRQQAKNRISVDRTRSTKWSSLLVRTHSTPPVHSRRGEMHQPGNGIRGTGSGPHPDGDGVRKPKRPQHAGDIGEDLEARRTGSTLAPRMKKIGYPPLRTQSRNPQGNKKPLDKTRRRQKKEEPKRHRTLNLKATDDFSALWVDVRTRSDRASVRTSRLFQAAGRKGFPSTKNSKPLGASIKRNPQVPERAVIRALSARKCQNQTSAVAWACPACAK